MSLGTCALMHAICSTVCFSRYTSWAFSTSVPAVAVLLVHQFDMDPSRKITFHLSDNLVAIEVLVVNLFLFWFGFSVFASIVHLRRLSLRTPTLPAPVEPVQDG